MLNFVAGIVLCMAAFGVQAQHLYRCGNSFSQVPCGDDAKIIKTPGVLQPPATPVVPERVEAMKAACAEWIRAVPAWKDRDSVKILSVTRGKLSIEQIFGSSTVVVNYYVRVNAKNSYGAYSGEKVAVCYANEHETRIIHGLTF